MHATPRPLAVQCALALDLGGALLALVLVPLAFPGPIPLAFAAAAAVPVLLIAHGVAGGSREACFYQAALMVLASLRVLWAYRPFGAVLTFALLHAWLQPDVLAYFGVRDLKLTSAPPAVAAAGFLAAAQVGWLCVLAQSMFAGYKHGLLAPFVSEWSPRVLAALIVIAVAGAFRRRRWAWLALPALLTPVMVAVYPLGWAIPAALGWLTPGTRAWFGLGTPEAPWPRRVRVAAVAALAVPALGFLAVAAGLPVGWCARHAWPLTLERPGASPLLATPQDYIEPLAADWEQMRIACALEEHAIALRELRVQCERARAAIRDPRALPACPLDEALRARLGAGALLPHAFGPAPGGRAWLTCTTCARVTPPEEVR